MGGTASEDVRVADHSAFLVYPFRHALSGKGRLKRLQVLEGHWKPWWSRLLHGDALESSLDDTHFFLPYIRELLFPETAGLPLAETMGQLREAERRARLSLTDLLGQVKLSSDAMLRLTFNPERLQALAPIRLEFHEKNFSAPLTLFWVDVALFPQNVGFLILKVKLDEHHPRVARLRDFLSYARPIHPQKVGWKQACWQCRTGNDPFTVSASVLVDYLVQGLTETLDRAPQGDLAAFALQTHGAQPEARYSQDQFGQGYGQIFHIYTYACLAGLPSGRTAHHGEDPILRSASSGKRKNRRRTREQFRSPDRMALYELVTCTDSDVPAWRPHHAHLRRLWTRHWVAYWDNWQGMALHDNVVLMGNYESDFTLKGFKGNVEEDYFHLYLFVLFQKTRLVMMFGDLIRRHSGLHPNLRDSRRLWDAFMMFQNHYWFSEVTGKPMGMELYRYFQRGMNVLPVYQEMSEEVEELQEYYESKWTRSVNLLVALLAFVGLPLQLVTQIFVEDLHRHLDPVWTSAAMVLVFGSLWYLWKHFRWE